jgi:muramoyltetrapeptide carboxypeptidase
VTVLPPFLKQGDTIGICAPARKVSREDIADGIALLQSKGLNVKESAHLYGAYNQFSGTDEQRISDFQQMMDDPDVSAIICARGGYGCMRIIDALDFSGFIKKPKWIIGFSDMTVFHNHLHSNFNIATIHAPMVFNMSGVRKNEESAALFIDQLTGTPIRYEFNPESSLSKFNRSGTAEGIVVGGNLSLLYALSNSVSDLDTNGKILFIEDLDEYLYHIDRMMMQLKRSGKLNGLAGLIVGGMSDMKDNIIPFGKPAEEIIAEAVKEYDFPVYFGFPAGHIPRNLPFVMGDKVKLQITSSSFLMESMR